MLEIVKSVKAEAEQEIIFAKAKLEVANNILARMEAQTEVTEDFTKETAEDATDENISDTDELNGI
jgi:ribosome recycling factor